MSDNQTRSPWLILSSILLTALCVFTLVGNGFCTQAVSCTALFSACVNSPKAALSALLYTQESVQTELTPTNADNELSAKEVSVEKTLQGVYSTPDDILVMEEEFRAVFGEAAHDGEIVQKKYSAKNATSTFENIAVRNTTPSHSINIEASLNAPLELLIEDKSKPTVLIYHTHTTEAYEMLDEGWFTNSYSTRSKDPSRNMVRVGDAICEELEKQGIGVIHDTEIHDLKYTGAYDHSRETITKILADNPTIQISIDVHRDAIHNSDTVRTKPVTEINGKKAAQVMIIAGCQDGRVEHFEGWEKNLTFDLRFQQTAETMFPSLMRPVLFSGRKYNMDLLPCSALFEFGSDSNTLAEAEYSGHLIGQALAQFINENSGG